MIHTLMVINFLKVLFFLIYVQLFAAQQSEIEISVEIKAEANGLLQRIVTAKKGNYYLKKTFTFMKNFQQHFHLKINHYTENNDLYMVLNNAIYIEEYQRIFKIIAAFDKKALTGFILDRYKTKDSFVFEEGTEKPVK